MMDLGGDLRSRTSYYAVLGVRPDSTSGDVRSAYRKLAMKWHPDRWAKDPVLVEEAKRRFQAIQEAYEVLSDHRKRTLYDAGLYDEESTEEEVEGFAGFLQEMLALMANVRTEEKIYSLEELQDMLQDVARGCDVSTTTAGLRDPDASRKPKRRRHGMMGGYPMAKMGHVAGRDISV